MTLSAPVAEPQSADRDEAALTLLMREHLGREFYPEDVARYRAFGWTAETYEKMLTLSQYALDQQGPYVQGLHDPLISVPVQAIGTTQTDVEWLVEQGLSWDLALAWVALAVSTRDEEALDACCALFDGPTPEDGERSRAWFALGMPGPILWASGLTVTEAQQWQGTQADLAALRLLIGLRGYLAWS